MNHYMRDVALYGIGVFVVGVLWEVVSALIVRFKSPSLPFGRKIC
jgi:hypothetical protein